MKKLLFLLSLVVSTSAFCLVIFPRHDEQTISDQEFFFPTREISLGNVYPGSTINFDGQNVPANECVLAYDEYADKAILKHNGRESVNAPWQPDNNTKEIIFFYSRVDLNSGQYNRHGFTFPGMIDFPLFNVFQDHDMVDFNGRHVKGQDLTLRYEPESGTACFVLESEEGAQWEPDIGWLRIIEQLANEMRMGPQA